MVTFTIDDKDLVMTVEEVGKISAAEFQRLYSVCSLVPCYLHLLICSLVP